MKNIILFILFLVSNIGLFAQEAFYIHRNDKLTLVGSISLVDSIYFTNDGTIACFQVNNNYMEMPLCKIDSITFGEMPTKISVTYNNNVVSILNPFAFDGISISKVNADVQVNATSELRDIVYQLSGTSPDGSFKVYSEKRYNIQLNNLTLTNPDGSALNFQSKNKVTVELLESTTNYLQDGTIYTSSTEDQKGTIFSEGQLIFTGTGSLTVSGKSKHAICCDDYVNIESGNIIVSNALKDGLHSNTYFKMQGGNLQINSTGDGIDCEDGYIEISGGTIAITTTSEDVKAMFCDSTLSISGGTINITTSGLQSKGICAEQEMILTGGKIIIKASGNVVLAASGSGYNPAYSKAIKAEGNLLINGSEIEITCSGIATKGISCQADFLMQSGTLKVTNTGAGAKYTDSTGTASAYSSTCITVDGNMQLTGGTSTLTNSGSGGKAITVDGNITIGETNTNPTLSITTTGTKISISTTTSNSGGPGPGGQTTGTYCEAKAIVCDGTYVQENGVVTINSADDGIKSESAITVNNGSLTISNSYEALESKFITINGGTANVTATNDAVNATMGTKAGGTEEPDGSCFTLTGGTIVASCSNGDAIDSNGNIVVSGGVALVHGPTSSPEEAADFNGTFTCTGGFFIGAGSNSNMNKAMSEGSEQYNIYALSSSALSAGAIFHLQDASGNDIITFKPIRATYSYLFSSPKLSKNNSYSIYYGGTYEGGTVFNGLCTGGNYTGGSLKKTFTISSIITKVTY